MTGQQHNPDPAPKNPNVYIVECDKRIANLEKQLAITTDHERWEERRDLQRRIKGYQATREIFRIILQ